MPEPLTLVVHNGAIARTRAGETLMRRLLPATVAREVLDATRAWREAAVVIFDRPLGRQIVYDRLDWSHRNRARFRERNSEIITQTSSAARELFSQGTYYVALHPVLGLQGLSMRGGTFF